jgi:GTPase SAR1 family protein
MVTIVAGVGKTCLSLHFTDKTFPTVYEATNHIEFGTRTVTVDDKSIKLHIWDTVRVPSNNPLSLVSCSLHISATRVSSG